ncbi:MAG: glycoside hydrolase family 9 protein [Clostridiales bacterium]|nr:glycoside hydrolase family 9 protein [Clostridiales bacterium]
MNRFIRKSVSLLTALALIMPMASCSKAEAAAPTAGESISAPQASAAVESSSVAGSGQVSETAAPEAKYGTSLLDTGNLTEKGSGYEGIKGTGKYNYGEALQKSILFYELQRSGDLPEKVRCNWRGDSGLDDGKDAGIDLTGGLYDAGDHVKFNLPMAYTSSMLAWSVYEYEAAYKEAGQLEYVLGDIRWITDYLIKCHPEDYVFYYQVGDGNADHSWWGPAEVMAMNRPSYKVTKDSPGSCVVGEAAAALASASVVFAKSDKAYSELCLKHAKSLFKFANETRSDAGYTAANGFYTSNSGFFDELSWAGTWLYIATSEKTYLDTAKECYAKGSQDYIWAMCWDDVHYGSALLLTRLTGEKTYKDAIEKSLDWWTTGTSSGERVKYTPKGLAWLDSWGSLRYATTMGFLATVYANSGKCDASRQKAYLSFAENQCNYALGSTGRSFVVGFGDNAPQHPHHRTAQGSWFDNMNEPSSHRHTLYGALVGGPDANDGYDDTVSNYTTNEVADDYNAGFTGLLAYMYSKYHGETIKDFGAVEKINEYEYFAEVAVNASGNDFTEIKALIHNRTGWPARAAKNVEFRYFIDLSEVISAGGKASDIEITQNYMQSGRVEGLKTWDESKNIYYLSVIFDDGNPYPGGQSQSKAEIQVRMRNPGGKWDPSNDPSYAGLQTGTAATCEKAAIYEDGNLVFGTEPPAGSNPGKTVVISGNNGSNDNNGNNGNSGNGGNETQPAGQGSSGGTGSSGDISVKVRYDSIGASANSISGALEIKNTSKKNISFSGFEVRYFLTNDRRSQMTFDCYYAGMQESNGQHTQIQGIKGNFSNHKGTDCDTVLVMQFPASGAFVAGSTVTVNFAIHYSDWQSMNTTNDHSAKNVSNIVIISGGKPVFGKEP